MKPRERFLALVVGALVVLAVLDFLVIGPAWAFLENQASETQEAREDLRQARLLVDNAETLEQRWNAFAAAGLSREEGALRIQVQQSLSVWAQESGFNLTTLVSGRTLQGQPFHEMQFTASGSGTLEATVGFLNEVAASPFPLRLLDLDLASRSETADAIALRATFSTIRLGSGATP